MFGLGWAGALGTIMVALTGVGDFKLWAWFCLILVLFITLVGRSAYQVLELAVKILAPIFIILLVPFGIYVKTQTLLLLLLVK